jgi:hypothetical protein
VKTLLRLYLALRWYITYFVFDRPIDKWAGIRFIPFRERTSHPGNRRQNMPQQTTQGARHD